MSTEIDGTTTSDFLGMKIVAECTLVYTFGSYTSITLGEYNNLKVSTSVEATLGLKFELNVAAKFSYNANFLTCSYTGTVLEVKSSEVKLQADSLFGERTKVVAAEEKAALSSLEALEQEVRAINSKVTAHSAKIDTTVNRIDSTLTKIGTTVTAVETKTTAIDDIVTRIESAEAKITQAGAYLADHETALYSSEISINDSGLNMLG
ncbi:hypothetical protein [uncultured Shewanella sp.]|uniref:hypothetical protein n=1 Tax=uncultured Shewanella sp. TaxID=173975 RepID=UPI0026313D1B|nr:hypothetical protein [uncultured Shewanella sp.]